jgi:hypothetical protein
MNTGRDLAMPPEKVQQVQNLRRSGASGAHGKKSKDRANQRRKVIEESRGHGTS